MAPILVRGRRAKAATSAGEDLRHRTLWQWKAGSQICKDMKAYRGGAVKGAVRFDADGGLEDIKFTGRGCAISQASASLMTMKLKGKSRAEVMEMVRAFHDLVTADTREAPKTLGDLRVMQGVRKFPQRVKCAMLAWRAVQQAFEQGSGEATVSTEPA